MKPFDLYSFRFMGRIFILVVAAILFSATSWADWRFLPALSLEESYDSNIYLDPDHETSDFITRLLPELRVEDVTATRTFAASYTMSLNNYSRHSDNNYIGHGGELSWDQQLSRNLSWHIRDVYYRSEEPLEENPDYTGVRRTRNEYSRNTVDTGFTYQFGAADSVTVSYYDNRLRNTDSDITDDVQYGPSLGLEYWLSHSHGLALGYSWNRIDYKDDDPSEETNDFNLGYRWRQSQHTMLLLDYGLLLFSSKASTSEEENYGDEDDYNVHSISAGFEHAFNPAYSLSGSLGSYFYEPKDGKSSTGTIYGLDLVRSFSRGSVTLSGDGGYRLDYSGENSEGFTETRSASLSSTYSIASRTELYGSTSYFYEKGEEEAGTRDETWSVSVGTSYQILSWLTGALELTQRERNSSDEQDEYRNSLILLRLRGNYEFR